MLGGEARLVTTSITANYADLMAAVKAKYPDAGAHAWVRVCTGALGARRRGNSTVRHGKTVMRLCGLCLVS